MKIKDSFGDRVFNGIIYAVLALLVLIVIYPLWLVVINSLSDANAVSLGKVTIWPVVISLMLFSFPGAHQKNSYTNLERLVIGLTLLTTWDICPIFKKCWQSILMLCQAP